MKVTIRFTAADIVENIPKFEAHTDYLNHLFEQQGAILINPSKLFWMRSDSETQLVYEVTGTMGEGIADIAYKNQFNQETGRDVPTNN